MAAVQPSLTESPIWRALTQSPISQHGTLIASFSASALCARRPIAFTTVSAWRVISFPFCSATTKSFPTFVTFALTSYLPPFLCPTAYKDGNRPLHDFTTFGTWKHTNYTDLFKQFAWRRSYKYLKTEKRFTVIVRFQIVIIDGQSRAANGLNGICIDIKII